MFCKLFVFATCVVVALSQANRYPAGVNPALCPNYPFCDNNLLAVQLLNAPLSAPFVRDRFNPNNGGNFIRPAVVPGGQGAVRQWPAGVNPETCPNYPYCPAPVVLPPSFFAAPAAPGWNAWSAPNNQGW